MDLNEVLRVSGVVMIAIAAFALIMSVLFTEGHKEKKTVFWQAFISALLLWYLSWLIG